MGFEETSVTLLLRLKDVGPQREIAWQDFRTRYVPVIVAYARRRGVSAQEVDDVIQEVLTGFYSAQPRFSYDPAKGRFRGYLRCCVENVLTKFAAKCRHIPGGGVEVGDLPDDQQQQAWEVLWQREQLQRAVETLRRHYQDNVTFQVFHRVVIQQQDSAVVGAELGLSNNAVYQAKFRAMIRMRAILDEIEEKEG